MKVKDDDVKKVQLQCFQEALLGAHLDIINYCIKWNYPLKRWRQIVNVMIQKVPGVMKIHRLR